jgi:hypothetical protein
MQFLQRQEGFFMDRNRIKLLALIASVFFILLAELNQRSNGIIFVEEKNPYGLKSERR